MRGAAFSFSCAALLSLCLSLSCTLLIDRGSLTNGHAATSTAGGGAALGGTAGASGQSASAGGDSGGSASVAGAPNAACTPADSDTSCDGLDQNCEPTLQGDVCPVGCTGSTVNGTSYMACTTSSSFDEAETRCQMQHMQLVEIDSASQNNLVVQLAQTLGSYVWIGGSNRLVDSAFAWPNGSAFYRDGAPIAGVYQNFGSGQPVNDATRGCVQIHDDAAGSWSNTRCSDSEQFICSRSD